MTTQSINWNELLKARQDFRRTWPQLLLTDLLSRALALVVLTPLVGLLLKLFLITADDGVLADADIAVFLLHPFGITALIVIGAVSLGVLFAEQGVLMVIGFGAVENRQVSWLNAFRYVSGYAVTMVTLAGQVMVRLLLVAAPFLAAIGGLYVIFLTRHDINFYLVEKPPEWWWAVTLAGLLMVITAILVLRIFANWILSLPMILFQGSRGREALRESKRTIGENAWKITSLLMIWLAGITFLSGLFTFLVGNLGDILIPDLTGNLAIVATGLGITLLVAGLGNLGIAIISTALFALLTVRLYRSMAGPGRINPDISVPGSLSDKPSAGIPGKAIVGIGAAVLLVVVVGGYAAARNMGEQEKIDIIAHRGASGAAPENTLAAFERAIHDQADWIELDVQENADGVVIVAHDSDFMKVAQQSLRVWDTTGEQLQDMDIGSWFDPEFSDQRVPTLREALDLAKGRIGVVIELKYYGHDQSLESRVIDVVEDAGMASNVKIMSLSLAGLRKSIALRPEWSHGLLNTASIGDLTRLDVNFLALNSRAASYAMIRNAHKRGMKLYVWTINDPIQMSVMMSRGAYGIITDEPALARQLIEFREKISPVGRLLIWIAGEAGLLRTTLVSLPAEDA